MTGKKVFLVCYPRVASRFFTAILVSKLGKGRVQKTHNRDVHISNGIYVGLIRNPVDQICSALAQADKFEKNNEDDVRTLEESIPQKFSFQSKVYIDMMNSIIKKADLILDYDLFTSDPDKAASLVLNMIDEPAGSFDLIIPDTSEEMQYMKSSKESENYVKIRSLIDQLDTSELMAKYYEVLALSKQ
jgi:hypothetical protein